MSWRARALRAPLPWSEVAKRTLKEVDDDNCFGLAAQLAFYFLLALFPALLFGVALLGYVAVENASNDLLVSLGAVAPQGPSLASDDRLPRDCPRSRVLLRSEQEMPLEVDYAGIIVTMLWFYVSSMAIRVGAEIDGVIEQASRTSTG